MNLRENFRLSPHGAVRCPAHVYEDREHYTPLPDDTGDEIRCAVCGQKPVTFEHLLSEIERIREVCPDIEDESLSCKERLGRSTDVVYHLCELLELADQLRGEE